MRRRTVLSLAALGAGLAGLALTRGGDDAPPGEICVVAPPIALDPAAGLAPLAAREVPAQARCPVCGMFPARFPDWAALAVFDDGAAQFLDSPLHLLLWLQRVPRYTPGREAAQLRALYLRDHATHAWLPAAQAFLVHGSDALGPMRSPDLPAFADAAQARRLAHGGARVLRFDELRAHLPDELATLAPRRHHGA